MRVEIKVADLDPADWSDLEGTFGTEHAIAPGAIPVEVRFHNDETGEERSATMSLAVFSALMMSVRYAQSKRAADSLEAAVDRAAGTS